MYCDYASGNDNMLISRTFILFLSLLFLSLIRFSTNTLAESRHAFWQDEDSVARTDSIRYRDTTVVRDSTVLDKLVREVAEKSKLLDQVKERADEEYKKSRNEYLRTKEIYGREAIIHQIILTLDEVEDYLEKAPDTLEISNDIQLINDQIKIAVDGIFIKKGMSQTYRNLSTSSHLIRELLYTGENRRNELEYYRRNLVEFKLTYDSLNSDSLLYVFPNDSLGIIKQITQLDQITDKIHPVDSILQATVARLDELLIPLSLTVNELRSYQEQIEGFQENLSANLFRREIYNIWDPMKTPRPFMDIFKSSIEKSVVTLKYYVNDRFGKFLFIFIIFLTATFFIRNLRKRQIEAGNFNPDEQGQLVLRYPAFSALIIVLSIFQFIFDDPPFIFNAILWFFSGIALTVVFHRFITRFWLVMWWIMLIIFALSCIDNLILQASRSERIGMLGLALFGVVSGLYYLLGKHKDELKERYIIFFIRLMVVLEFISVIANLYGRYNFAKSMFIAGFSNLIIGILFLWTIRLLNESLALASQSSSKPVTRLFYFDFNKIGDKVPSFFYVFMALGWFVLVGSNFYAYRQLTNPLRDFFFNERTIGDYTFSLESILVFLIILVISLVLSKLVSYFAPDVHHAEGNVMDNQNKKVGMGSWVLLLRIFIISMGLFLAFAAAGIPMDRITIILGALGVGIGLGLQGLVNNLVSGLILAFEKPVKVGDILEINGKPGVMKSIGFRSSVIMMVDGAQVVIPNGDILNQQLVNWTAGQGHRRVELLVGVAYGTDLEKTREVLMDVMKKNDRVLTVPPPIVLAQEFKDSSIEFRCNFWVNNFMEWALTKSEIIRALVIAFRENGIEIPFPQRDLYIKKMPAGGKSVDKNFKPE